MTERNPYSQYNYDTFDQPTLRRRASGGGFGSRMAARFSNPVFATAALLLTGAAFAGIIVVSYPRGGATDEAAAPIIQADAGDLRQAPADPGGLEIPHQDSTVFNNIQSTQLKEGPPVEDLLAEQKPIDKLEAFAKEAESMYDEDGKPKANDSKAADKAAAEEPAAGTPAAPAASAEITEDVKNVEIKTPTDASNDNPSPKTIHIKEEVQKIPPQVQATNAAATAASKDSAFTALDTSDASDTSADATASATPQIKHPAGSSPETLAFVQSVLHEKDGKAVTQGSAPTEAVNTKAAVTQPEIAKIEPASGAAAAKSVASGGSYYVQLGSVTSEDGVPKEWVHLQKLFSSLKGAQYRVQKANLGERGVRYRIQAGPMDKTLAGSVCDSIKAQKPGGCLIVQ